MKKMNKIIIGIVITLLVIAGGSYGIYANVQYQKEVKLAEQHKKKVVKEEKQVNDLQKTFDVRKDNAQEILKNLSDLKLTTNKAKKIQEKFCNADKQQFVELENEIISGLTISDKDKKFSEISSLQENVKAIQNELGKVEKMTSIFTDKQIKVFTDKLNALIKSENNQITQLQKIAKEKSELEATAKAQQEAENARLQAQEQANYETQSQNSVPNGSTTNTPNYSSEGNTQSPSNSSGDRTGVIDGTNNGVGWAMTPDDVPPGAVIQPPR